MKAMAGPSETRRVVAALHCMERAAGNASARALASLPVNGDLQAFALLPFSGVAEVWEPQRRQLLLCRACRLARSQLATAEPLLAMSGAGTALPSDGFEREGGRGRRAASAPLGRLRRGRRRPRVVPASALDEEPAQRATTGAMAGVEYDTKGMLAVEQAVPHIMDALS